MSAKKKTVSRPGVTKLPVFNAAHPRPRHARADGLAKTAIPLDSPVVADAARVSAIHARQPELVGEIIAAEEKLKALVAERENLFAENVTLRDRINAAIQPDAWANATASRR